MLKLMFLILFFFSYSDGLCHIRPSDWTAARHTKQVYMYVVYNFSNHPRVHPYIIHG